MQKLYGVRQKSQQMRRFLRAEIIRFLKSNLPPIRRSYTPRKKGPTAFPFRVNTEKHVFKSKTLVAQRRIQCVNYYTPERERHMALAQRLEPSSLGQATRCAQP
jgi:hypothetical protein